MKTILLIGHCDLRVFLKNPANYIWLFAMPLVFVAFMGFAFRAPDAPGNVRPKVRVINRDTNYLAAVFIEELGGQGLQVLEPGSTEKAPEIRLAPDFTARILAGEQSKVRFLKPEDELTGEGAMVELRLVRALIAVNSHLLAAASTNGGVLTEPAVRAAQREPGTVRLSASFAGRKPVPVGFGASLPGNLVMYVMLNLLIFGGASVVRERQNGVLRRLVCNPVTRAQVVAGKIYGLVLLGSAQVVFFLLAGRFLFHVNLGSNLGPVLLTMLVYAWVAASLGVLVGSLVKAEDKVVGLCLLASLLMAALGGCWWPLEIVPAPVKLLAHCLPTGQALEALHQLITFGGGLREAAGSIGILVLFGLAANALAAWRFRT